MKAMLQFIQNDPEVPPGNIVEHLTVPYVIHHPYRGERLPEADQISALIVLGGSMGANDDERHPFLGDVKKLIRQVVAMRIPCLGICLGGQLLAAAVGAKVESGRWEESGTLTVQLTEQGKTDPLFNGIAETFSTFQWHHTVLISLAVVCCWPLQLYAHIRPFGLANLPGVCSSTPR